MENQETSTRLIASVQRFALGGTVNQEDGTFVAEETPAGWADHATVLELESLLLGGRKTHYGIDEDGTEHGKVHQGYVFGCRYSDALDCRLHDGRVVRILVLCGNGYWKLKEETWLHLGVGREKGDALMAPERWQGDSSGFPRGQSVEWRPASIAGQEFQSIARFDAEARLPGLDFVDRYRIVQAGSSPGDGGRVEEEFVGQATVETKRMLMDLLSSRSPHWEILDDGSIQGFDRDRPIVGWFDCRFENGVRIRIDLYGERGPWHVEGEGDYIIEDYRQPGRLGGESVMKQILAPEGWE